MVRRDDEGRAGGEESLTEEDSEWKEERFASKILEPPFPSCVEALVGSVCRHEVMITERRRRRGRTLCCLDSKLIFLFVPF
jgi:hypothetical protein